ncbi:rhoGEF domain-containing protein gxcI isoform X2 [Anthonomus grandis grandis]|uniref:rhoGEF domain-containing protein gxcI isoform X2 n=1 Tax=Anthonomus grandis grandis TaxID=2921223 RepID=UPI002165A32D|nr:rhoGEF domain-containing protein gxcI isoform X2 [Anthonomus grandis grandis]
MSLPWQEGCLARCQDCVNSCPTHLPGFLQEEPYKRFMTIGSVRYGMRVGAVSPPPPGAGPRYRSRTCCWPSAASHHDTVARIPLLPTAHPPINSLDIISYANRTEDAIATSDQTFETVRDHVPNSGGCLLNQKCAFFYSRLVDSNSKDNISNLDRLPRFRFGGNRAEKRGGDKFREFTERLKRSGTSAPVPPPRRHTRATPPPVELLSLPVQKPNSLPLRSASFSQVDYCHNDNKYVRRCNQAPNFLEASHNTLPRPKNYTRRADAFGSTSPFLDVPRNLPQLQITESEFPEKTIVRTQDQENNHNKKKDKLKRRKGIYLSQWPTNDVENILPKYEQEVSSGILEESSNVFKEPLSGEYSSKNFCIIGSSPQEEPLSPEDNCPPLKWPDPLINNNIIPLNNNALNVSVSRSNSILPTDSLSEGEPESNEKKFDQISLAPSDISDCESRVSCSSDIPRRYSKRPLRGPYGQMLEAEMKKPESRRNISNDLKFLEDMSNTSKSKHARSRGSGSSSTNDSFNRDSKNMPVVKRKVSVGNLNVEQVEKENSLIPNHQRTTSSPSKLEGLTNTGSIEPSNELLEQLLKGSSEQLEFRERGQPALTDTRTHVLIELFDNERIYVESLEIIVQNYWEPLKKTESTLMEQGLVEDIFAQIPFLLNHHKTFLIKLKARLETCETRATIGDLFLEMLTVPEVIENYVNYVNNWKRSRDILKTVQSSRPQFARFLDAASKSNVRKQALDSLLIKPIQKFPKYELLLQRLIKHTADDHPDYVLLLRAQKEVHEQLLKINCTEKEALDIDQLRELEGLIEGVLDLVAADRQFIRHDMVIMSLGGGARKDRALFLLTDLLLITGIKRRSGTITKKMQGAVNTNNLEGNKFKLMMRVPLEDVEIIRSKDDNARQQQQEEIDNLNEDIAVLNKINDLSLTLHCNHSNLDDLVKELIGNLNKQLQMQQSSDMQLCVLDLSVLTQGGIEMLSIVFPKAEVRASWEETLMELKSKLGDRRPTPEMLATVPVRKTRAGLQFTCAAPTLSDNGRDVWICNSDSYVGQVCILTLNEKPEPAVTSCNGVCNTRILCIASVPGPGLQSRSFTSGKSREKLQTQKAMQFDSSSSSDEDDRPDDDKKSEQRDSESSLHGEEPDKLSTMWLGTEDGCIHIYNSNDNIRIKKNKVRLQLGSAILCIM